MSLVIKGNQHEAFEALNKHGIDGNFVRELQGSTVCEAMLDDDMPIVLWYTEPHGKTMPIGSLLLYTHIDSEKSAA